MVQYLKRWESPRRQGRNDKGKGGAARKRQLKKRQKMLRQKLKHEPIKQKIATGKGKRPNTLPLQSFWIKLNYQSPQRCAP